MTTSTQPALAIVATAHGYGHLTRQLALASGLRPHGIVPTVFTHAPKEVVHGTHPEACWVSWEADVGIVQTDGLTEDLPATRARLDEVVTDQRIDALAQRLASFDAVVVDAAPPALEACRRAGVRCLCIGNFDWAWIYAQYPTLSDWSERFAAWQAPHAAVSLWPGPGMHGFASVSPVGLLGRRGRPHPLPPRSVLVSFGGFGLNDLDRRLPRLPTVTWVMAPPMPRLQRDDVLYVEGVAYPDLVAGADVVLTKPGYGIFAEASLAGTRIGWWPRGRFPEAAALIEAMNARGDRQLDAQLAGLDDLLEGPWPPPVTDDRERLVRLVLGLLGHDGDGPT